MTSSPLISIRRWMALTSSLVVLSSFTTSCSTGERIVAPEYAFVSIKNTTLDGPVTVTVSLGQTSLGTLSAGNMLSQLVPYVRGEVMLAIDDITTGRRLLDTTFVLQRRNAFETLLDTLLGVEQFVSSSSEEQPVPSGHRRFQIVNRIAVGGIEKRVTFKLFMDSTGLYGDGNLREMPQRFENIEYGAISEAIDIPVVYYRRSPVAPRRMRQVYLQAYDAASGELLVDVFEYGTLSGAENTHWIVVPKADIDPDSGKLLWAYSSFWAQLQMNK